MAQKHVVVIGAGFGGLSAAAYIAKSGHRVTVLEKNSSAGGRAMVNKTKGFTFDLGPSWYMMPDIFDEFFGDFNKNTSDYYRLTKLNPAYRVYSKSDMYDVSSIEDGGLELFDKIEPGSAEKVRKLLTKTRNEYNLVRKKLLNKKYLGASDIFDVTAFRMLANPELLQSYHSRINKYVKDNDLQQILEFMVVFMGGSPRNIPALYTLLTHVDFGLGIWYPKGGFGAVVSGFERLSIEQGVSYRYNTSVTKIEAINGRAVAVWAGEERISCDAVVANADYHHVETKLLDKDSQTYNQKYWQNKVMSPSGHMLYLGVGKKVKGLKHHTLFFDTDWDGHFNQVFNTHSWSNDPLFYVGAPSKSDDTVAPKNNENIFVLAPMSGNLSVTQKQKDLLTKKIIERIENKVGQKFGEDIIVKDEKGQDYFETTFNAYKGNAFGLAHTLGQSAMLRPRLQSKKVKNLVYTGQYTNPGTGVPMVVLSGKLAAQITVDLL